MVDLPGTRMVDDARTQRERVDAATATPAQRTFGPGDRIDRLEARPDA